MVKKYITIIALLIGAGFMLIPYDALVEYKKKRDFKDTPEPQGSSATKKHKKPIFVIQQHDASHMHYDLRLEIDGVLVSWAVPKGPSTDPHDKRLAIETEDHPMDYATFEGIIPEGNYGAGSVIVWDKGTYENIKEKDGAIIPMNECHTNGQIEIVLHGKKLQGGYALVRTHLDGKKNQWLLIKMNDDHADARRNPVSSESKSVLSEKTIEKLNAKKKLKK